jgi:FAD linked oxidases, C-terminal domain
MRSEYDDTALTLMRAIKNGVDPKGIMNPGTLLPLRNQEILSQTSTIDMQSLNEWIVKPKDLEEPVEMERQLSSIVQTQSVAKSSKGESWWNEVKRWGSGITRNVIGSSSVEVPVEVKEKEVLEVWADQGDRV